MGKLTAFLLIAGVLFASNSCSWIDARIEREFKENIDEGCSEIKRAADEAVNAAKDTIANTTISSVQSASADLSEFLSKSVSDFERKVSELESRVDKEIDSKLHTVASKSDSAMLLALIACLTGIAGTAFALYALFSLREKALRRRVVDYVIHSRTVSDRMRTIAVPSGHSDKAGLTLDDVRKEVRKSVLSQAIIDALVSEILQRIETGQNLSAHTGTETVRGEEIAQTAPAACVLYARNSSDSIFSDVSTVHQKGKTIYRLILDTPDSASASVELCTDKEDVVGRVLRFDDETLEPVCSVTRMSASPQTVRVTKPGRAEKISANEWKVIGKVEIELS